MTNNFVRALLQHRNTNLRGLNESQAQIVYGAEVRDTLLRASLKAWTNLNDDREMSRARIRHDRGEAYNVQNSNLEPLKEGDTISTQDCTGPKPLHFDRSGIVIQEIGNRQYQVKTNGSGRILLRNRKHLRKLVPFQVESSVTISPRYVNPRIQMTPRLEIPRAATPPHIFSPPGTPTPESTSTPSRTTTRQKRQVNFDTPVSSPRQAESPQSQDMSPPSTPQVERSSPLRPTTPAREPTAATPTVNSVGHMPSPVHIPAPTRPKRERKIPSKFADMVPTSQLDI